MAKTKKLDDFVEGVFPLNGIDVSHEYSRQPEGTAPVGINVRATEPTTDRERGASRSGLVRWIDETVGSADEEIQHLNVIVTAGMTNLLAAETPPFETSPWMLDPTTGPRNPGRLVPVGGSGVQTNRNVSNLPNPDEDVSNFIPGDVETAGVTYAVNIIPAGTRTVSSLGPVPVSEGQPVIVVKIGGTYYMQGGP